jgi:predicted DNA-binding protein
MQGHGGENKVSNTVKRPRYFLDIEPELRNRIKAVASLHGKTMRDWVTEAILEKLEDDIDAREGLAVLGEVEDTISLKDYLESRKECQRV